MLARHTRLALALVWAGCAGGEEPRQAPAREAVAPAPEPVPEPEPEPGPSPRPEPARDIPVVPEWLARSLTPIAREPSTASPAERCAMGCAYRAADGSMLAVTPLYVEEDGTPSRIELTTLRPGGGVTRRTIDADAIPQRAWERYLEGGDDAQPPWIPWLAREMRLTPEHRPADDLVVARATLSHSLSDYAPLVQLGGLLHGSRLYFEIGETAYRLHLVSEGRSRLLATWPLDPTPCEAETPLTPCVEPRGIAAVYEGTTSAQLLVRLDLPIPGHGGYASSLAVLSLADADALDPRVDEASRAADLERSLRAPGARVRLFEDPPAEGACSPHCAWFGADGSFWLARGERLREGWIERPRVFEQDGSEREVLTPAGADGAAVVDALERALEGHPAGAARHVIVREAHASWRGTIHAPLVELGAPHAGRRLEVREEGHELVVSWITGAGRVPAGRTRVTRSGPDRGPPGIVDVIVPEGRGFPIIVVLAAVRRLGTVDQPLEHDLFHVVVRRGPEV